jgi:hypothetical protein
LYGDADLSGVYDFVADGAALTAVLDSPATPAALAMPDALAEGLQLPGWRPNSTPRLILLMVTGNLPPGEEMMTLAETAVSQNSHLYILQDEEVAAWPEVAEVGNGRVLLLPNNQQTGALGTAFITLITEALAALPAMLLVPTLPEQFPLPVLAPVRFW